MWFSLSQLIAVPTIMLIVVCWIHLCLVQFIWDVLFFVIQLIQFNNQNYLWFCVLDLHLQCRAMNVFIHLFLGILEQLAHTDSHTKRCVVIFVTRSHCRNQFYRWFHWIVIQNNVGNFLSTGSDFILLKN